jgi:uncharacterized DUF497 family protein
MDYEWDEAKRRGNLAKHGLDFADADLFEWRSAIIRPDHRYDYGEDRYRAWAPLNGRVHSIGFTRRDGKIRLLSFRRANRSEERRYEKEKDKNRP